MINKIIRDVVVIMANLSCSMVSFLGGIGTIVPGLFVKLRQGIYYEIRDEQQSKVRNMVIDW